MKSPKNSTPQLSEKKSRIMTMVTVILMTMIGFFIGQLDMTSSPPEITETAITQTIPTVTLTRREGDQIFADITGEVKIIWADHHALEGSGVIIWSQIPTTDDLQLNDFAYLANAKTKKFYPANSYPARGTEVRYRRFFQTRQAAIEAGFVPSKLVK